MKKLVALFLVVAMALPFVGCGENDGNVENEVENEVKVEITDANEILTKVWETYSESATEDTTFYIMGGNVESMVEGAPAVFDTSLEGAEDTLIYSYCIPEEVIAMTDDIATMRNSMMVNNFTCAALHMTDVANVDSAIAGIKDATLNNQWMCGFPEKLVIATIGEEYVVYAYGNGMVIDAFASAVQNVYGEAAVFTVEENIVE